jgi:hypothetical protein
VESLIAFTIIALCLSSVMGIERTEVNKEGMLRLGTYLGTCTYDAG